MADLLLYKRALIPVAQGLGLDPFSLDAEHKPSAFLAGVDLDAEEGATAERISGSVWEPGQTVNGAVVPESVTSGYTIAIDGQTIIFQTNASPFAAGGLLTEANIEAALAAHADALAVDLATRKVASNYEAFLLADL
jgi:hypothetical protein